MALLRYVFKSLAYYRFAYAGVLAGGVLGVTVLLGALFAGDSVEASLRQIGALRTGRATHVVSAGDRFFRQALADELAAKARVRVAPVVYARGTAGRAGSPAAVSQTQLIGVTEAFWLMAPKPARAPLDRERSAVAVNATLARRAQLSVGDTLVVRLQKPGILAGNAPVAGAESTLQSIRCKVAAVLDDSAFGRFSLESTQMPQPSVFLPIELLQESLASPGRANLILIDASGPSGSAGAPNTAELERALAGVAQLADYGLALKWIPAANAFEVNSNRIFIDPPLVVAIQAAVPTAQPVISYLVNEFRVRGRSTPYSIGTATTPAAAPFLPELGPRDVVLNEWLARDLQAAAGDDVRLTYFQAGAEGALVEQTADFRVHSVIPLQGLAADRAWMPDFPGMSDAATPGEWDPGLPLKLDRIRPEDERYWEDFRGAPKAFLSLAGGRALWSTRWGDATALRLNVAREREAELTGVLLGALRPPMNQMIVREFRAAADVAAAPAVDFGGLFAGMSFFLILAALGLVAMLFQLGLLQRNREDALLGAVGLSPRRLLWWRLAEAAVILLLAFAAGLPLAAWYTGRILGFLETIWAGQGAATFVFAARPMSVVGGGIGFGVLSLLAVWLAIRRQTRRTLSIRLAAQAEDSTPLEKIRRSSRFLVVVGAMSGLAAMALSGRALPAQGAFYLAGFAFLITGLAACRGWMANPTALAQAGEATPAQLGILNLKARRSRNLTVVALIAAAVFMVLSVASFRKQVGADWLERGSGTGGFAFWVESTAALNPARDGRARGFEIFERDAASWGQIVPLRAGIGDNVNCFNLNTTSRPRLLAVDAGKLAARQAFKVKLGADGAKSTGWEALRQPRSNGAYPALVDETTLQWALKRQVGDELDYPDENGRTFRIQIVGTLSDSLFQGYLLLDEALFLERFPSHPGYSVFLVDAVAPAELLPLRKKLETAVADVGGRVEITRDILAAFHQIENTYIAIFNVLGALGVVLGSLGLAIVVARNLRERRGEFAVMGAMGIPTNILARMIFAEFGRLVAWGIVIGAIASGIAVWPNLAGLPATPTIALVAGLLVGIVALNLASGWLVFRWSLRGLRLGVEQAAA